MLVGYMPVSSEGDRQTTALQRDALLAAGVDERHLFEDKASGARDDRPGLARALEFVRQGECLVVWKLDRLGRSLPHLLAIVTSLGMPTGRSSSRQKSRRPDRRRLMDRPTRRPAGGASAGNAQTGMMDLSKSELERRCRA